VRISAKGEYAIKAMLDLALAEGAGLRPIQDIAGRQDIPQRYLEQVLLGLTRAGLLVSKRGSAGGYRLARTADQVTVGDVLRAVDGSVNGLEPVRRGLGRVGRDPAADLSELWREIDEAVSGVIDRVTFDELRKRAEERRSVARPMYHI
jgi:Rrf2 family transcriptional regulator, cysteine metabolism repressor